MIVQYEAPVLLTSLLFFLSVVQQVAFTKGVVALIAKGARGVGELASKSFLSSLSHIAFDIYIYIYI